MDKLKEANNIFQKLISEDARFSPITKEDRKLFEDFLTKQPHSYGNSWIYITQGLYGMGEQKLGYKFYDGQNLSAVGIYPKIEKPDQFLMFWVRPMGDTIEQEIQKVSARMLASFKIPTYVKKIYPTQFAKLQTLGFVGTNKYPWHSASHSEDDTYPELIYDRASLLSEVKEKGRRQTVKKIYLETEKLKKNHQIEIKSDNFAKLAWEIVTDFFENKNNKRRKLNISNKYDYFNMIFQIESEEDIYREVLFIDGEPAGFYVAQGDKDHQYLKIYALITINREINFSSDLLLFHIFQNYGYKWINIGGSEDLGIHSFKLKYHPAKENTMLWATNYNQLLAN